MIDGVRSDAVLTGFRLLGPVEIRHDERWVGVPGRQVRTVLAALLLGERHGVTVDRLVDVLWGDQPPPDAAGKVHVAVSRLRRLLADAGAGAGAGVEDPSDSAGLIVHRGGRYALAVSPPVD